MDGCGLSIQEGVELVLHGWVWSIHTGGGGASAAWMGVAYSYRRGWS